MKSGGSQIVGTWLGSPRGTDWENDEANRWMEGGVYMLLITLLKLNS